MRREPADRGAGTVLVLGLVFLAMGLAVAAGVVGRVVVARHEAARAADLAALAAATVAVTGSPDGEPCAVAAQFATRNQSRLTTCDVDATGIAVVTVAVAAGRFEATARARAGPADSQESSANPVELTKIRPRPSYVNTSVSTFDGCADPDPARDPDNWRFRCADA